MQRADPTSLISMLPWVWGIYFDVGQYCRAKRFWARTIRKLPVSNVDYRAGTGEVTRSAPVKYRKSYIAPGIDGAG